MPRCRLRYVPIVSPFDHLDVAASLKKTLPRPFQLWPEQYAFRFEKPLKLSVKARPTSAAGENLPAPSKRHGKKPSLPYGCSSYRNR